MIEKLRHELSMKQKLIVERGDCIDKHAAEIFALNSSVEQATADRDLVKRRAEEEMARMRKQLGVFEKATSLRAGASAGRNR